MESMETTLKNSGEARQNIILAALAELSARYLDPPRPKASTSVLIPRA